MKIGDKLYCILELPDDYFRKITKGKIYSIQFFIGDYFYLNTDINKEFIGFRVDLLTLQRISKIYPINFYDHFITLKEFRKQKLLKLNGKG